MGTQSSVLHLTLFSCPCRQMAPLPRASRGDLPHLDHRWGWVNPKSLPLPPSSAEDFDAHLQPRGLHGLSRAFPTDQPMICLLPQRAPAPKHLGRQREPRCLSQQSYSVPDSQPLPPAAGIQIPMAAFHTSALCNPGGL